MCFHIRVVLALIFFSIVLMPISRSERILAFFPSSAKSHMLIQCTVANILAEAGHNVTVISNVPNVYPNASYNYMRIGCVNYDESEPKEKKQHVFVRIFEILNQLSESSILSHAEMKKFLKDYQAGSFDLFLLGYYLNDFHLGLAAHFQIPAILLLTVESIPPTNALIGNPVQSASVPAYGGHKGEMTFFERVKNFLGMCMGYIIFDHVYNYQMQKLYNINFPSDRYPPFEEVRKNVSMVLSNHHFSQGPIRPHVPALVEIGGIQIKETPDVLPPHIAEILNNCENGVIYISFGSKVKPSALNPEKQEIMLNVLSELPYTVLWKWDNTKFPNAASNIHFSHWLPQTDILAHPKIKLFITHGGLGSIVEAEYNGVPMVAIPFMSDQPLNVKAVESSGFGLGLDYATLTTEQFNKTLLEVLQNTKYKTNVKQFATLYKDRPLNARQTLLYWVNYVIRYNGAFHMQSPAIHLNFWQLKSIDVIIFLVIVLYTIYFSLKCACKLLYRKCQLIKFGKNFTNNTKKDL